MKTLYVTDLDGTLLTRFERVSEYSRERLNGLLSRGLILTFATARSAQSARAATEGVAFRAPAILYNGGLVYDYGTGETLRCELFREEEKREVYSVLASHGVVPFSYGACTKDRERVAWQAGKETEGMRRYLSHRVGDARLVPVGTEEELLAGYVFYFKCIGPREKLEAAWNVLKYDPRFICIFHQETYQNDFWMEISPRAANKSDAVRFLKERLGCERAVCFGDTSNDSDMFDVCDEKYAVMNADDWLKAKATGIVGYCEEDGVVKWLEAHSGF